MQCLNILAKDFIETAEGLIFAVVENTLEQATVLCFLRYINQNNAWTKVNTEQANQLLTDHYPEYLYYSPIKQASCHGVCIDNIVKHHQPRSRLKQIIESHQHDLVEKDLLALCYLFSANGLSSDKIGVTGSLLISAQKTSSDIDLVFYSRDDFNLAREVSKKLILQGDCSDLSEKDWQESYKRRSCDLTYDEYLWHEQRKFNKLVINHRKVDLNFVNTLNKIQSSTQYTKLNTIKLKVKVIDATLAFDYPAEYSIEHDQIKSIVCYTATYTGQTQQGEWIVVSGQVEQSSEGVKRIVVGSSREAPGEYIKVIK